jgi:hypothetical protein
MKCDTYLALHVLHLGQCDDGLIAPPLLQIAMELTLLCDRSYMTYKCISVCVCGFNMCLPYRI